MTLRLRHARGVSLIEVLVSLVILSLGVLAVVGLQLVSRRNNADAGQRTIAAQLAYDMVERMRANASSATLPNYVVGITTPPAGALYADGAVPSVPNCASSATACTPDQVVTRDLWAWELALEGAAETVSGQTGGKGGLVSPLGCIRRATDDGGGDGIYMITIAWRGSMEIPDNDTLTDEDCGRVGQPGNTGGLDLYGANNTFRRTLSLPVYITARRTT
jgi:type IV pilus assembly protein PilV